MAAAYAIVSGDGSDGVPLHLAGDIGRLAALAAWRPTQGIYRFDQALFAALIETPITADLPVDVFFRLPEWCVYVETPSLVWQDSPLYGFFAHMEWDTGSSRPELRLLLDSEADLTPVPLHIGKWPLAEAVSRALDLSKVHAASQGFQIPGHVHGALEAVASPLISLLLYLCADDAEIGDSATKPTKPQPKRTKAGWRLFAADRTTTWEVGVRIGAALRQAQSSSDGGRDEASLDRARPRAHIRRAHWHTFLAGVGRSERRIKWLPPVPVNVDDFDALPAVVKKVT